MEEACETAGGSGTSVAACFIGRFLEQTPTIPADTAVRDKLESAVGCPDSSHLTPKLQPLVGVAQLLQGRDAATWEFHNIMQFGLPRYSIGRLHTVASAGALKSPMQAILSAGRIGQVPVGRSNAFESVPGICEESSCFSLPAQFSSDIPNLQKTHNCLDYVKTAATMAVVPDSEVCCFPKSRGSWKGSGSQEQLPATADPTGAHLSLPLRGLQAVKSLASTAQAQTWTRAFS
jgi:hypothetical protein